MQIPNELIFLAPTTGPGTSGLALSRTAILLAALLGVAACSPTVKVEAPDKPIEITMNVNINHEIRIKVEEDIDEMVSENSDLY